MKFTGSCEDLLWETGRSVYGTTLSEPAVQMLDAYRTGHLSNEDTADVERRLARAPEARRRMAELAGIEAARPDSRVREAVLAGFGRSGEASRVTKPRTGRLLVQVAAALAVALSLAWFMSLPEPLPANLAYEVQIEGLTAVRSSVAVEAPRQVDAYPDTRIRITASPQPDAVRQVEFGLYRAAGSSLERLELVEATPADGSLGAGRLEIVRGAAVVTARAGDLAPTAATRVKLFLVAARPGDLPRRLEVGSSSAAQVLEQGDRRQAYPLEIRFVSASGR